MLLKSSMKVLSNYLVFSFEVGPIRFCFDTIVNVYREFYAKLQYTIHNIQYSINSELVTPGSIRKFQKNSAVCDKCNGQIAVKYIILNCIKHSGSQYFIS